MRIYKEKHCSGLKGDGARAEPGEQIDLVDVVQTNHGEDEATG